MLSRRKESPLCHRRRLVKGFVNFRSASGFSKFWLHFIRALCLWTATVTAPAVRSSTVSLGDRSSSTKVEGKQWAVFYTWSAWTRRVCNIGTWDLLCLWRGIHVCNGGSCQPGFCCSVVGDGRRVFWGVSAMPGDPWAGSWSRKFTSPQIEILACIYALGREGTAHVSSPLHT